MESFRQADAQWRGLLRHAGGITDTLRDLDAALTDHHHAKHKRGAHKVWRAFAAFTGELDRFMAGLAPARHVDYLEYDYGCWDMCIATLVKRMEANFFRHDDDTAMAPNPRNLLLALQSWQIVTLTGYMDNLYLDPVSVVTNGQIQLIAKEDYGREGVAMSDSQLLQAALPFADRCGIVLNVDGHEAFGDGDNCHWIIVEPPQIPGENPTLVDNVGDREAYPKDTPIHDIAIYAKRGAFTIEMTPA
jgi:hypothetical protein